MNKLETSDYIDMLTFPPHKHSLRFALRTHIPTRLGGQYKGDNAKTE